MIAVHASLIVIVVVVVLLIVYVIVAYNGLVRLRNQVENAWAQIDVQLKRRYDLIPNLVETVKGYAAHERETLEAVIQARNTAIDAPARPAEQAAGREHAHRRPEVSCSPCPRPTPTSRPTRTSCNLQEELTATEGRDRLRAAVLQRHRARATTPRSRRSRPTSSPACCNFSEREYFEADEAARSGQGPVLTAVAAPTPPTSRPLHACTTRSPRTSAAPSLLDRRLRRCSSPLVGAVVGFALRLRLGRASSSPS